MCLSMIYMPFKAHSALDLLHSCAPRLRRHPMPISPPSPTYWNSSVQKGSGSHTQGEDAQVNRDTALSPLPIHPKGTPSLLQ